MLRVRLVTDSTADLAGEDADRLGITMVPLRVRWDDESYRDKVDISIDEFYQRLKIGQGLPKTSQPPVGEFEVVYRRLLKECEGVISIHLPRGLSGTVNAARTAALNVDPDRIVVFDSQSVSYGIGLILLRVARLAEQGASLAECAALVKDLIPRVGLYCLLDTLEFLRRGGRIGRVQAMAGTLLSIKPIVTLEDGMTVPVERVRTMSAAIRRTVELLRSLGPLEDVAVLYGDDSRRAGDLRRLVQEDHPDKEIRFGRIGSTIGTHTGPGVLGAVYLRAKSA